MIIRLEGSLQPNIGFTLRSVLAVLKRSAITLPKVNRQVHCRGLALADFGRDPHSSDSWRAKRNFVFFVRHDFTDFPSDKFHKIRTQHVDWCRDENFLNRILKIYGKWSFSKKRDNFSKIFTYCNFRPP